MSGDGYPYFREKGREQKEICRFVSIPHPKLHLVKTRATKKTRYTQYFCLEFFWSTNYWGLCILCYTRAFNMNSKIYSLVVPHALGAHTKTSPQTYTVYQLDTKNGDILSGRLWHSSSKLHDYRVPVWRPCTPCRIVAYGTEVV